MTEKFARWDPAEDLKTEQDFADYFAICVEEDPGDGSLIRRAQSIIARARSAVQPPQNADGGAP